MKAFLVEHPAALAATVTAVKLAMRDLPAPPSAAAAAASAAGTLASGGASAVADVASPALAPGDGLLPDADDEDDDALLAEGADISLSGTVSSL